MLPLQVRAKMLSSGVCDVGISSCENGGAPVKYLLKKATEVQLTVG